MNELAVYEATELSEKNRPRSTLLQPTTRPKQSLRSPTSTTRAPIDKIAAPRSFDPAAAARAAKQAQAERLAAIGASAFGCLHVSRGIFVRNGLFEGCNLRVNLAKLIL
jgi:hypothetical protein